MSAGDPEPVEAPLIVVHGQTPIARAVLAVAAVLGYRAVAFNGTVSPGGNSGHAGLAGASAVVTATHGGPDEVAVLRAALTAGVPYIGLVAGRARGEEVLAGLGLDGDGGPIHTPAGLDIGAGTPEEVALAILAEFVSTRPRRPGQARAARGKRVCDHGRSS